MPNTLVQFRIDDTLRRQASDLCTKLGFDLTTYLRMSLARENGNSQMTLDEINSEISAVKIDKH